MSVTDLELAHVTKTYRDVRALESLSLAVDRGELMCLLGPSGCGKTTTLRIIAGFEAVDRGDVRLGGHDITRTPPDRRDIGVVFQNYALFPHLTVDENVGFGLRMRRRPRREIASAVGEALALVRLPGVGRRYPKQLSGGQQQRVALARALAIRPRLLLLDEPLSNLDARLREEMRVEIRQIQQAVGITTVFVTHDQEEALALADRIAVMDHGRVVQVGPPVEIYERPAHPFVAGFIGQSNLLRGRVEAREGRLIRVRTSSGLTLVGEPAPGSGAAPGEPAVAVIKHERIAVDRIASTDAPNSFAAKVEFRTYLGDHIQYVCSIGSERLGVSQRNQAGLVPYEPGEGVYVSWRAADCLVLLDWGGLDPPKPPGHVAADTAPPGHAAADTGKEPTRTAPDAR